MSIGIDVTFKDESDAVMAFADKSINRGLNKQAYATSQDIKNSLLPLPGPSRPGEPPHSHTDRLRRAVGYAVDGDEAFVGPRASIIGDVGHAFEFGGEFRGHDYEPRPFVEPAMERQLEFFAANFGGTSNQPSIGE